MDAFLLSGFLSYKKGPAPVFPSPSAQRPGLSLSSERFPFPSFKRLAFPPPAEKVCIHPFPPSPLPLQPTGAETLFFFFPLLGESAYNASPLT